MLYILMPEGQAEWYWRTTELPWQHAGSMEDLIQQARAQYTGSEAILYVPTQHVQLTHQPLTRTQYRQLGQQGVRYLVEEMTIDAVDQLAIFSHYDQGHLYQMTLPQSVRQTYQHSIDLLPWKARALLPDFLLLPVPDQDEWVVGCIGSHQLVRWSAWQGWVWEQPDVFSLIAANHPTPVQKIRFYQVDDSQREQIMHQLTTAWPVGQQSDDEVRPLGMNWQAFAELPLVTVSAYHPFNMLQKQSGPRQLNGYWVACAALLCVAVLTQAIYDGLRWWRYQRLSDQTAQLMVNQYKQWFPNDGRITEQNVRSRFRARLASNATADRQALNLLSRFGPVLQQNNLSVEQVTFAQNNLTAAVLAPNPEALNQLMAQLKQQGLSVSLGTVQNRGSRVVGLLTMQ